MVNGGRRLRVVLGGLLVILLAVSGAAACGVPAPPPGGSPMGGGAGPMRGDPAPDEATYLAEMIPHHQEAVAAATQLARSPRPEMRALGERIVTTQTAEIQQMAGWLATWYPEQPPGEHSPMMRDLSTLTGDDLDRAFLTDMIPHHMRAVMMSQRLLVSGAAVHPEVAAFAGTVRDSQRDEIVLMRGWLTSWFPGAAGPGGMGPDGMHGPAGWPR
jgi:uncharacterized protein (DUF305 family)